ncbi:hypothetical protein PR048_008682 [Dryococelus australis]|uniref:Uncharacterized protein n=1 Tax=Dryococelus australis TaxID=614101 RepID=A0ABQ9HXT3_9NEOP|nr:hypothetical protein PR048_008682 [Dryococelus australis]
MGQELCCICDEFRRVGEVNIHQVSCVSEKILNISAISTDVLRERERDILLIIIMMYENPDLERGFTLHELPSILEDNRILLATNEDSGDEGNIPSAISLLHNFKLNHQLFPGGGATAANMSLICPVKFKSAKKQVLVTCQLQRGECSGKALKTDYNEHVTSSLSRDRLEFIMTNLLFCDNENLDDADLFAKWNDNNVVSAASNTASVELLHNVPRFSQKKKKKRITIPQPSLINKYNKGMGGVDRNLDVQFCLRSSGGPSTTHFPKRKTAACFIKYRNACPSRANSYLAYDTLLYREPTTRQSKHTPTTSVSLLRWQSRIAFRLNVLHAASSVYTQLPVHQAQR